MVAAPPVTRAAAWRRARSTASLIKVTVFSPLCNSCRAGGKLCCQRVTVIAAQGVRPLAGVRQPNQIGTSALGNGVRRRIQSRPFPSERSLILLRIPRHCSRFWKPEGVSTFSLGVLVRGHGIHIYPKNSCNSRDPLVLPRSRGGTSAMLL